MPVLVGLNCRDLGTLEVDFDRFRRLADRFPPGVPRVAESGLDEEDQAAELAALGYDAALVGSALMRAPDPAAAAAAVLGAGRRGFVAHDPVWVKICGLTRPESVLAVREAGADAAGFVFAESPRRVTPTRAAELAALLPPGVARVAVFLRPSAREVADVLAEFPADLVQCEPSAEVADVVRSAGARLLPVLHDGPDLERQAALLEAGGAAPAAILEGPGKGGRGVRPDWSRAASLARHMPLVLAGGLAPDNVADAIRTVRPYGVDVSSGVEEVRGRKDPVRIAAFVQAAKTTGEQMIPGAEAHSPTGTPTDD